MGGEGLAQAVFDGESVFDLGTNCPSREGRLATGARVLDNSASLAVRPRNGPVSRPIPSCQGPPIAPKLD